jgi:CBS domain-containing protein
VTQGDRPVGVITDRDILMKVVANGFSVRRKQVWEFMTSKPVCVAPEATMGEATKLMRDLQLRHLPVVENERLVGVLSVADLASILCKNLS